LFSKIAVNLALEIQENFACALAAVVAAKSGAKFSRPAWRFAV
jgi:hypothetical protein